MAVLSLPDAKTRDCLHCGTPFAARRVGPHEVKYCSLDCGVKFRSRKQTPPATTECRHCGKPFRPEHSNRQKHCSPECRRAKAAAKRRPGMHRGWYLRATYGLTLEQYQEMVLSQCGSCAICGDVPGRPLFVDHDHKTGEVRALLCLACNSALGQLKDDPRRALRASEYLNEYQGGGC